MSNVETSSNIQTIEDQAIELNNQDNEDLTNPDFQTHAPLSDLQTNSTIQTHPGIYGPGNPHPNAFKKKFNTWGLSTLEKEKENS
ncbi:hypothetical protein F8M41_012265 [Gigaspora margarita]|uniref:Uncharacterized protein n=1 Tax=Gigaspora margarita TaxID=4874 RepID=A0A8H4EV78_GIGMA|nr:hypothetical protein F8M41_012265 [Gigaspora margarita]